MCGGETACLLCNFNFGFRILTLFFSRRSRHTAFLIAYLVHISGKVFFLVPIPGYFVDGYTRVWMAVPNVPKT